MSRLKNIYLPPVQMLSPSLKTSRNLSSTAIAEKMKEAVAVNKKEEGGVVAVDNMHIGVE